MIWLPLKKIIWFSTFIGFLEKYIEPHQTWTLYQDSENLCGEQRISSTNMEKGTVSEYFAKYRFTSKMYKVKGLILAPTKKKKKKKDYFSSLMK